MDSSAPSEQAAPPGRSPPPPRREMQGSRPAPLRLRRDSHRIRKPVIIYTVSPRVIHVEPGEFMSVVQRLTGAPPPSPPSSLPRPPPRPPPPPPPFPFAPHVYSQEHAPPPAARLAATEQAARPPPSTRLQLPSPSILSPAPGSLPEISPDFFSIAGDVGGGASFFSELSPAFLGQHRAFLEHTSFFGADGATSSTPMEPSPGAYYWDLFNQYQNP